ncbi:MAG: Gfo/Idh/MocA family oxidoreductase, partial [Planctomycetota bacterium]
MVKTAVVGVGAFGSHHARIYHELADEGVRLVGLVDIDPEGPRALAERLGVPLVPHIEDLPEPVDAV